MIIEYDPISAAKRFEEMPEPGDVMVVPSGEEHIILSVAVVNKSKLKIRTKIRGEVKRYDKPLDASMEWDELPERFLEGGGEENVFLE